MEAQSRETKSQRLRKIFWPLILQWWTPGRRLHTLSLCKWNWKELVYVGSNVSKRHPGSPDHHVIFLWIIQPSSAFQSAATPGGSCHLLRALFGPWSLAVRGRGAQTRATFSPASQRPLTAKDVFSSITHGHQPKTEEANVHGGSNTHSNWVLIPWASVMQRVLTPERVSLLGCHDSRGWNLASTQPHAKAQISTQGGCWEQNSDPGMGAFF